MASLLLTLFSALLFAATITESEAYSTTVKAPYPGHKPEKLIHLHFYFHDVVSAKKPTSVVVASSPTTNSSATAFGMVAVVDDILTVGPEITSEEVGRAQGIFAATDQNKFSLLMAFNFVFTKGEFSGNTASMYGRNAIMSKVREMPIIGGKAVRELLGLVEDMRRPRLLRSILPVEMLWSSIMSISGINYY